LIKDINRNKTLLPFGSVKSVHSFLRGLWAISSVAGSVKFVFKALGWLFAEDGDKTPDYGFHVNGLGVELGVEQFFF